jgi:two-component system, OmpR family, phosphate regulon sensor histidine kinase PhoR
MSRRTIVVVILLAIFSLAAIVAGQVFWVRNAFNIQERQFNDRVVIALTGVVEEILILNKDSAVTEPVKQVANNYFVANINDSPAPYLLENLLKEAFERSNLNEDFEYGIYDCFTDSIVFGGHVSFSPGAATRKAEQIQTLSNFTPDGHYFGVFFPNKSIIILKQLDFWMYSSMVIILIIIFFSYAISVILRQKRLSEVKADFVNNMTHELKTPISTISLSADALSNPAVIKDPLRLGQYVSIIKNENNRLKSQVEKVLQIATLSPKDVNIKWEQVDMHKIISTAVETFVVRIENEDGTLKAEMKAEHFVIYGDLIHLTNVIHNLLDNACKYNEDEPHIVIQTYNKGSDFYLAVQDDGIGIEKEHIKMIFDKFYRVPTGNLHEVKGFGLGLFYVQTIVKALKGKISVESVPEKGSTFTLKFKYLK